MTDKGVLNRVEELLLQLDRHPTVTQKEDAIRNALIDAFEAGHYAANHMPHGQWPDLKAMAYTDDADQSAWMKA